ncbi:probable BNA1-3-hydroxyanthranilic acid dioxygenase [Sporisorium reilianum SRZ2]|uniref:3-hydroxyanthranilate 3,4-dioxygenase n=2 Tax=Sporisorium reilianum TaxID=72558 RepID=E6ZS17_SPORE|nr:probable BNA1-3-hydroxyanthranilic acid dioxygenase [Sporisorium reilianum SRZ2]SJX65666.1 probable BNA1-3-hydroxyanthranilic acid dioxygenase [Sporisorium reilianum f. sp. reilianum]
MPLPLPLNFPKWLSENEHLLQPPVGNFCLYRTRDYTVMAVGGPNARSDYHFQPTEEFFYQYKGDMLLKVINEDGKFEDINIREGEMFMLPAHTPHSPVRFANTVGIVVERTRPEGSPDAMRWYCPNKQAHGDTPTLVKEVRFQCTDLGTQLKPIIEGWVNDEAGRKCGQCGYSQGARELPA